MSPEKQKTFSSGDRRIEAEEVKGVGAGEGLAVPLLALKMERATGRGMQGVLTG